MLACLLSVVKVLLAMYDVKQGEEEGRKGGGGSGGSGGVGGDHPWDYPGGAF